MPPTVILTLYKFTDIDIKFGLSVMFAQWDWNLTITKGSGKNLWCLWCFFSNNVAIHVFHGSGGSIQKRYTASITFSLNTTLSYFVFANKLKSSQMLHCCLFNTRNFFLQNIKVVPRMGWWTWMVRWGESSPLVHAAPDLLLTRRLGSWQMSQSETSISHWIQVRVKPSAMPAKRTMAYKTEDVVNRPTKAGMSWLSRTLCSKWKSPSVNKSRDWLYCISCFYWFNVKAAAGWRYAQTRIDFWKFTSRKRIMLDLFFL